MSNHHPQKEPGRALGGHERPENGVPRADTIVIFQELVTDEIRSGRLTRAQRRRIVRYAAALGLSAVDAGILIADCRNRVKTETDPVAQGHALRLVEPDPTVVPAGLKLAIAAGMAIVLNLLLISILW